MKRKIKKYIIILVVVGLAVVGWLALSKKAPVEYLTTKVTRGKLTQSVTDTGAIKTAKEFSLNFLNPGKLARTYVSIGDAVKKDQLLAELDYSSLSISEKQARASLVLARANYNKLIVGASVSDLSVGQASARQAEAAYQSAQVNYEKTKKSTDEAIAQAQKNYNDLISTTASNAFNKRDQVNVAVEDKITVAKTALDTVNRTLNDENAKDTLSIQDQSQLTAAKVGYADALLLIPAAEASLIVSKISKTDLNLDKAADDCLALLNKTYSTLSYTFSALQKTVVSSKLTQTSLDSLKSSISSQLTLVSTGISAVQTANQTLKDAILSALNALNTAKTSADQQLAGARSSVDSTFNAWQVAKAQLTKLQSPARAEDIASANAQVTQAQAALETVLNQISNNLLKAPLDGVVTEKNYELGEMIGAAKPLYVMISKDNYEIDIDISETDINKIKIGNPAEVTFDAFGEDTKFQASVVFIEPAQTVIQDVIYYKTTISDLRLPGVATGTPTGNYQIKPGMTANATITTAEKENVLFIPARAVIEKDNKQKVVRVLVNEQSVEKPVTLGLRGDNGLVEIVSGLAEGEEVITSVKTPTTN
jgi:RND family efflux transporter MFP subunit